MAGGERAGPRHRLTQPGDGGNGRGRAIAFGARALEADAKPKYINSG